MNRKKIYFLCFSVFIFFCTFSLVPHGFIASTLVKTPDGYRKIQDMQCGDCITCYNNNNLVDGYVTHIHTCNVTEYVEIVIKDESIACSVDQQLYLPDIQQYEKASDLQLSDQLSDGYMIQSITRIDLPVTVYTLTVKPHHNFCVSPLDVQAHNIVPAVCIGASWAFGSGAVQFGGFTLSAFIAGIGISAFINKSKNNNKPNISLSLASNPIAPTPNKNDDKDKNKDKKKNNKKDKDERDAKRAEHKPLTNKQARQKAKELRYKEDPNPPFDSKGRPAFRKGNDWISPDRTAHKGGVWKRFAKGKRIGTFDISLTTEIGT